MSRVVWIAGGVGLLVLAGMSLVAGFAMRAPETPIEEPVDPAPSRRVLSVGPAPDAPAPAPSRMVRFSMAPADPDLPRLDIRTMRGGDDLHREVTETLQDNVLRPCRPPHSLRGEDQKHQVRLLYTLGPKGLTEFSVTPLDPSMRAESTEPVPASWLDCVQKNLEGTELPGVGGTLTHGLVYSWRVRL